MAERRAARLEVKEPGMETLLLVLDLIGTFVFALSGATAGVKRAARSVRGSGLVVCGG
jgi:hypothetical protein